MWSRFIIFLPRCIAWSTLHETRRRDVTPIYPDRMSSWDSSRRYPRDLTIAPEHKRTFALTNNRRPSYLGPMTLDDAVATVQLTYPQVYHACHTRHQRKRTTEHALSARDSAILAHCGIESPIVPAKLARHLSIAASTLSEAIKKLTQAGYVRRVAQVEGDGRHSGILLTAKDLCAVRETSV